LCFRDSSSQALALFIKQVHVYFAKSRASIIGFLIGLSLLVLPKAAGAQEAPTQLSDVLPRVGNIGNLPVNFYSLAQIVATVFNIVIGISGAIFMVLLLIGGIQYLTGAGNEESTTKAKKLLIDAVIGLVLTLSAWAIGTFILTRFYGTASGIVPRNTSTGGIGIPGGVGPVGGDRQIINGEIIFTDINGEITTTKNVTRDGFLQRCQSIDAPVNGNQCVAVNGTKITFIQK